MTQGQNFTNFMNITECQSSMMVDTPRRNVSGAN
jgi:hypothetical protein